MEADPKKPEKPEGQKEGDKLEIPDDAARAAVVKKEKEMIAKVMLEVEKEIPAMVSSEITRALKKETARKINTLEGEHRAKTKAEMDKEKKEKEKKAKADKLSTA